MTELIQKPIESATRLVCEAQAAAATRVLRTRSKSSLTAPSGASASLDDTGRTFLLRDAGGQLVCEFDSTTGRLVLHAKGDLEVRAPVARLTFDAVRIGFQAEEVTLRSNAFTAECERTNWKTERWELRATRIAERALDKLVDVEAALQVRAGRVRSLVGETWELLSRRTRMVSKENTSIDGEKILLG